jgi:SAM-dependent methyltransferase
MSRLRRPAVAPIPTTLAAGEVPPRLAAARAIAKAFHVEQPLLKIARRLTSGQHWCRVVMDRAIDKELESLRPPLVDVVEVSGSAHGQRGWRSYTSLRFPDFDLCNPPHPMPQFDVVICEQVLEHVPDPITAIRTLRELTRPGGTVIVSTPFLLGVHPSPGDYWRFTPDGLTALLRAVGLQVKEARSWGNAACVRANFRRWRVYRRWHSLEDDPHLPVVVWAVARRPVGVESTPSSGGRTPSAEGSNAVSEA